MLTPTHRFLMHLCVCACVLYVHISASQCNHVGACVNTVVRVQLVDVQYAKR